MAVNSLEHDIERQLVDARRNLLDLTLRNKLLNYRPSKAKSLQVFDEIPREIFQTLVLDEKQMYFKQAAMQGPAEPEGNGISPELARVLASDTAPERHADKYLQTGMDAEHLQPRLFKIFQESQSIFEELGYPFLHLALGFLKWVDPADPSKETRRAPLILIPVEMKRAQIRSAFHIEWSGGELTANISLQEKAKELGVLIPDFQLPEAKEAIDEYLAAVKEAIADKPGWDIAEEVALDFFSFSKICMYKDLDPSCWPAAASPAQHPLIRSLFGPVAPQGEGFPEEAIDRELKPEDLYQVLDADPSQIVAIEEAKRGRNLVVEGPPGTGKSQTITNLVAELLAQGKTVLFVSEKMAALEVVKSRLDEVGLGPFCLELHSRKTTRKELLKELERTLNAPAPIAIHLETDFSQLLHVRDELDQYVRDLREPYGPFGRSPYQLLTMRERARQQLEAIGQAARVYPRIEGKAITAEAYESSRRCLQDLVAGYPDVRPVTENPWLGCSPRALEPARVAEVEASLRQLEKTLGLIGNGFQALASLCGTSIPQTTQEADEVLKAATGMTRAPQGLCQDILRTPDWETQRPRYNELRRLVVSYREKSSLAAHLFHPEATAEEAAALSQTLKRFAGNLLRTLSGEFRQALQRAHALYREPAKRSLAEVLADLNLLLYARNFLKAIRDESQVGADLFGALWQGQHSDLPTLDRAVDWISAFRADLRAGALTEAAIPLAVDGTQEGNVVGSIVSLEEALVAFHRQVDGIASLLGLDSAAVFAKPLAEVGFAAWADRLPRWLPALNRLQAWGLFVGQKERAQRTLAAPIARDLSGDLIPPAAASLLFDLYLADSLIAAAFQDRPDLGQFMGAVHEGKIHNFADLDRELIQKNRQRLSRRLYDSRPTLFQESTSGSQAGVMLGEINRKRGHLPIRRLLELAGELVLRYKPCFMMSPLSIAQFLHPRGIHFDVIVFDEASQVRPEDALGSLLRGSQLVVMGDTQQLPPTSFFDHVWQEDGAEEVEGVTDVESILHLCRRRFPAKYLRWHYRSRHESLVAVSNQEFYENRLLIYPSAYWKAPGLGLSLHHLPQTVYDRGRSQTNRQEAAAVAAAAIEHYRKNPEKSLGIGTFNIQQQEAIWEEMDLERRCNPELEDCFQAGQREHFFVKNLETIQGDERDVIFLSLGYGFDAERRISMNFGPLNQEGGERRLNVLITRAREKCVIFSNFRASDLTVGPTSPKGLRVLKSYLEFAETGRLATTGMSQKESDNPFEEEVARFLREQGYEVRTQVGCAGYRIDLAVVDPGSTRYQLGIECDGTRYHSASVACDRDRLRRQILESLGWTLYRIWSTDWYRDPARCREKLLLLVRSAAPPPPPAPDQAAPESVQYEGQTTNNHLKPMEETVAVYQACTSLPETMCRVELTELPPETVAMAVTEVVRIESPIHTEGLVRRIRDLWGLKRAGNRVQEAVGRGIGIAILEKWIERKGDFLYLSGKPVAVRRRVERSILDISLISEEEILEAAKLVLTYQFSTAPEDLAAQAARLLGFRVIHETTATRIRQILDAAIANGPLLISGDGKVKVA
jgi:very-short-patch-repair endonuclease/DNA polymerase III delta prime subunit